MSIQDIKFSVLGQEIRFSNLTKIVANSVNIVSASFSFSQEWNRFEKKAIFTNGNVSKTQILTRNTVEIPPECLVPGMLVVSVVGVIDEPYTRLTTKTARGIPVENSGALNGDAANVPTPTEAEQILLTANSAEEKAQVALARTNAYKGLRLARRIVLTEAVSSITFDTDDDGKPLDSKLGGELLLYSGENSGITTYAACLLQLNKITGGDYWSGSSAARTNIQISNVASTYMTFVAELRVLKQYIICTSVYAYRYTSSGSGSSGGMSSYGGGVITPQETISAINIYSGYTFPVGTVLEWWERG